MLMTGAPYARSNIADAPTLTIAEAIALGHPQLPGALRRMSSCAQQFADYRLVPEDIEEYGQHANKGVRVTFAIIACDQGLISLEECVDRLAECKYMSVVAEIAHFVHPLFAIDLFEALDRGQPHLFLPRADWKDYREFPLRVFQNKWSRLTWQLIDQVNLDAELLDALADVPVLNLGLPKYGLRLTTWSEALIHIGNGFRFFPLAVCAAHLDCPPTALEKVWASKDAAVIAARMWRHDRDDVQRYARHRSVAVRRVVARDPRASLDTLALLAQDSDDKVRTLASENPNADQGLRAIVAMQMQ